MNTPQPGHFTVINIKNKYVAKTVAHALFKKYEVVVGVVDSTAFDGYNLEVGNRYAEISEILVAYAEGVRDFLEKVVNFDIPRHL